ncbi:MAG: hypothetical protein ACTIJA_03110 [Bavariicoccus seileri]|uniref:IS66 family transposase n=1 Tax=Bavariicoccus seileri TaxID=549685 RepID=UPI003F94D8C4
MTETEKQLMKQNEVLLAQIDALNKQAEAYTNELRLLREQVDFFKKKFFGRSSEKSVNTDGQLDLFDDDDSFRAAETTEEKTVIEEINYKRKKRVGYKAELTEQLPKSRIFCRKCHRSLRIVFLDSF